FLFFLNDPATPEIYTLSLHDALPIFGLERLLEACRGRGVGEDTLEAARGAVRNFHGVVQQMSGDRRTLEILLANAGGAEGGTQRDRKSTRLNSSHVEISYAVFCLKKK